MTRISSFSLNTPADSQWGTMLPATNKSNLRQLIEYLRHIFVCTSFTEFKDLSTRNHTDLDGIPSPLFLGWNDNLTRTLSIFLQEKISKHNHSSLFTCTPHRKRTDRCRHLWDKKFHDRGHKCVFLQKLFATLKQPNAPPMHTSKKCQFYA